MHPVGDISVVREVGPVSPAVILPPASVIAYSVLPAPLELRWVSLNAVVDIGSVVVVIVRKQVDGVAGLCDGGSERVVNGVELHKRSSSRAAAAS